MNVDFLALFHVLSLIIGLGGATYSDLLLFHFLKDLKVNEKEAEIIEFMGKLVFVGVGLAAVSGGLLVATDPDKYLSAAKFQAKMVIFAVVVLNGVALHKYMLPRLLHVVFSKEHTSKASLTIRRRAFMFGAVSVVSWYSVFFLGFVKSTIFSPIQILMVYALLLIFAIAGSLCVERFLENTAKK